MLIEQLINLKKVIIEQLINLKKVRTDNLKFRTDLRDRVMDGWPVTQEMNVYKGRLLKKSSNRKSKLVLSTLVTTVHGFQTFQFICDLFGCKL